MNVADLITEFGAYYLNHGQGVKDLHSILRFQTETDALFTVVNTDDTVIRRGSTTMTRLLQPFQKSWSPTGTVGIAPAEIKLFKMKVDFQDYPDELEETWAGFLADNKVDRKEWPFVKWLMTQEILAQIEQDYELNEVYKGVFAAPGTPGTAGAVSTAMDGIKEIINNHIDAGDTTAYATGALSATAATFTAQIEEFAKDAIPIQYRNQPLMIAMAPELEMLYKEGKREIYNMSYAQEADLTTIADLPMIKVVGAPSMIGSKKIWCTPKKNAIVGYKRAAKPQLTAESVDRQIKIFGDFYKGVGFVIPELIWTNDQELPA
jgi:hypothetical protein